jgi:hypothetical protein
MLLKTATAIPLFLLVSKFPGNVPVRKSCEKWLATTCRCKEVPQLVRRKELKAGRKLVHTGRLQVFKSAWGIKSPWS